MRYVTRTLERQVLAATRDFPALVLTGPRRAGKTFLLRHLFPRAAYYLFEDPDVVARFRADPQGFLDEVRSPAILDEIQNVPEVFNYVRSRIDRAPRRKGQWLLTGSQEAGMMRKRDRVDGRTRRCPATPADVGRGRRRRPASCGAGSRRCWRGPGAASLWFSSYLQTYLERDVRSLSRRPMTWRRSAASSPCWRPGTARCSTRPTWPLLWA